MMVPLFWFRMIGITCSAASTQLFRLICDTTVERFLGYGEQFCVATGKADADIAGRISMRPQRSIASSTIALISAFLVTLALSDRRALFLGDPFGGFLREGQIVIDAQHFGAFAGERRGQWRGPPCTAGLPAR